MPYSQLWDSTQHCFCSRTSLHSKWSTAFPHSWNSLVLPCSLPCKAAGLIELRNGLLKTQLQCQLGGNTLQARAQFSRRLYLLWISGQHMMLFLPQLRFMGLGIMVWKWRWYHDCSHDDPLSTLLLSVLATLCSSGIVVFTYKGRNASAGRHNNHASELEVKTPSQPLCTPHSSGTTGKEGWLKWPILTTRGKLAYYSKMEVRKSMSRIQEIS